MTATTFFVAPDAAQAQYRRLLKGNSYDELMQRARNQLEDARALKCYKSEAEREKYFVELNALRDAITARMKSDYPQVPHEPLDPHIDRLDRSPSDLHHLGQAYKSFYGKTLEEAVKSDLSGKLQIRE